MPTKRKSTDRQSTIMASSAASVKHTTTASAIAPAPSGGGGGSGGGIFVDPSSASTHQQTASDVERKLGSNEIAIARSKSNAVAAAAGSAAGNAACGATGAGSARAIAPPSPQEKENFNPNTNSRVAPAHASTTAGDHTTANRSAAAAAVAAPIKLVTTAPTDDANSSTSAGASASDADNASNADTDEVEAARMRKKVRSQPVTAVTAAAVPSKPVSAAAAPTAAPTAQSRASQRLSTRAGTGTSRRRAIPPPVAPPSAAATAASTSASATAATAAGGAASTRRNSGTAAAAASGRVHIDTPRTGSGDGDANDDDPDADAAAPASRRRVRRAASNTQKLDKEEKSASAASASAAAAPTVASAANGAAAAANVDYQPWSPAKRSMIPPPLVPSLTLTAAAVAAASSSAAQRMHDRTITAPPSPKSAVFDEKNCAADRVLHASMTSVLQALETSIELSEIESKRLRSFLPPDHIRLRDLQARLVELRGAHSGWVTELNRMARSMPHLNSPVRAGGGGGGRSPHGLGDGDGVGMVVEYHARPPNGNFAAAASAAAGGGSRGAAAAAASASSSSAAAASSGDDWISTRSGGSMSSSGSGGMTIPGLTRSGSFQIVESWSQTFTRVQVIALLHTTVFHYLSPSEVLRVRLVCKDFEKTLRVQKTFLAACIGRVDRLKALALWRTRELKYNVSGYMDHQPQINSTMRSILVDWMVDVKEEFRLLASTCHLSVRLLDRLLHTVAVPRKELQLAGAACILVAAKAEEAPTRVPTIDELQYLCDGTYTHDQIRNMEQALLNKLHFCVHSPTAYNILEFYLHEYRSLFSHHSNLFANYLVDLSVVEYGLVDFLPSLVATAIAILTLYTFDQPFNELLVGSGFTLTDLIRPSRMIINRRISLAAQVPDQKTKRLPFLHAVHEQYHSTESMNVGAIPFKLGFIEMLRNLPPPPWPPVAGGPRQLARMAVMAAYGAAPATAASAATAASSSSSTTAAAASSSAATTALQVRATVVPPPYPPPHLPT